MPNRDNRRFPILAFLEGVFKALYDLFHASFLALSKLSEGLWTVGSYIASGIFSAIDTLLLGYNPAAMTQTIANIATTTVSEAVRRRLGLTEEEQEDIRTRAQLASDHLSQAGVILADLQSELDRRSGELDSLLNLIDSRRAEAEHWAEVAATNEKQASALIQEIESRVGKKVQEKLEERKVRRRVSGILLWVLTLVAGALIGAIVQQWWQTGDIIPVLLATPTRTPTP